ncbi:MAG: hypothetical protein HY537_00430 [Deltaproteobacteria bacterium]|nr:hypothetical protein [Deltaproteobacteria bacterium]
MIDMTWLSQEATRIHGYFCSLFYTLVTLFLLLGVLCEHFKLPIGGVPSFAPLVGRALIAALLLHCYPDIARILADISDAIAKHLGNLNQFKFVLERMSEKMHSFSWSWVSVKGSLILLLSFITFFLLYFSVHVTQAFLIYTWTVLYVFSPILIALYVLPQTASATSGLFRSLFEASVWKIVWAVLATLLWSTGASEIEKQNIIAATCFNLILAGSLLLTPLIVHLLAKGGLSTLASAGGSMAVGGIASLTPAKVAVWGRHLAKQGYNQSISAATVAAAPFPKAQKVIKEIPKFNMPKHSPLFEKKDRRKRAKTNGVKS